MATATSVTPTDTDCARRVAPAPIPAAMNVLIAVCAGAMAAILLRTASHCESWWAVALCAIGFSFVGNTIFACLHECVHGIFHPNRRINDAFGVFCAALFPTGFSLQRSAHLAHHRNNRSENECFDYLFPGDNRLLKVLQWYGIISGIYWATVVLGWIVYLLFPFAFSRESLRVRRSEVAEHTSGPAYARAFAAAPPIRSRVELLITIALQLAAFRLLDLSASAWLVCYVAFGINWSSLQYADHAFSRLDVVEGAWDLRVNRCVQAVYLNYHLHLAHHRHPALPWIYLPRFVDRTRERPRFIIHYARMWLGPRGAPERAA